jgi:hypothetical protein
LWYARCRERPVIQQSYLQISDPPGMRQYPG